MYVYTCMMYMYVCLYMYACMYVCMYVCMYICVYAYMYVYVCIIYRGELSGGNVLPKLGGELSGGEMSWEIVGGNCRTLPTDTIRDLLNVGRVRKRRSAAISLFRVTTATYSRSF